MKKDKYNKNNKEKDEKDRPSNFLKKTEIKNSKEEQK